MRFPGRSAGPRVGATEYACSEAPSRGRPRRHWDRGVPGGKPAGRRPRSGSRRCAGGRRRSGCDAGERKGYAEGFEEARKRRYAPEYAAAYREAYAREFELAGLEPPEAIPVRGPDELSIASRVGVLVRPVARSSAPGRRRFGRGNSSSSWHALRRSTSRRSATGLGRRAASTRIARPKSRARSSSVRSKPRGGKPWRALRSAAARPARGPGSEPRSERARTRERRGAAAVARAQAAIAAAAAAAAEARAERRAARAAEADAAEPEPEPAPPPAPAPTPHAPAPPAPEPEPCVDAAGFPC